MLKKLSTLMAVVLLTAGVSLAQWTYEGVFPPPEQFGGDTLKGSTHALTVDPDGKVWVSNFYATGEIVATEDYILNPGTAEADTIFLTGDTVAVREIYVFNADGTEAAFSPISSVTIDGFTDYFVNSSRGMRADADGNIFYASFDTFFKINYQTGEGMAKLTPIPGASLTAPAFDDANNLYVAYVVGGNPLLLYNSNLESEGTLIPGTVGFSRAFEVAPDGNTIYWAGYTNGYIMLYTKANPFAPWDSSDAIVGPDSESFAWNKGSGNLYFSGGSYNDLPDGPFTPGTWYGWNPDTKTVVDSFSWQFTTPMDANERPRGIDFSPDGTIAYVGTFGLNSVPAIQKFVNPTLGVRQNDQVGIVEDYQLKQNYPNPFNPTTKIDFAIKDAGHVSLKVYNMLGQEVRVLVDGQMNAGSYTADFNAEGLSSGTYIYQLNVNGKTFTNKMSLVK